MWGWLKPFFDSIVGGILDAWKASKAQADAAIITSTKIVSDQSKNVIKQLKKAAEVTKIIRISSDNDIDNGMRPPNRRGNGNKK